MLSKAIVFIFSFLGIFTLLLATFNTVSFPINQASGGTPTAIAEKFTLANMTVYGNGGNDNMTYPYSSLDDSPTAPDWETNSSGKYLEVWWGLYSGFGVVPYKYISLRDVQMQWWGRDYHGMTLYLRNGLAISTTGIFAGWLPNTQIIKEMLVYTYETAYSASYFHAQCEHLTANILFQYNQTTYASIGDAWDAGDIGYSITYGLDYTGSGLSAWSIVGALLSFQAPNIGITGVGGTILSGIIAAPIYACIAYLAYKFITGIIPWVSGGSGD